MTRRSSGEPNSGCPDDLKNALLTDHLLSMRSHLRAKNASQAINELNDQEIRFLTTCAKPVPVSVRL